jgi:hypothetical protein
MKKAKWIVVLILLAGEMGAQKYQGIQLVGIQGFKTDFGLMSGLSYQKYLTNKTSLRLGGYYEDSRLLTMRHNSYYANIELFKDFFKPISRHTFNVGGGISINIDQLDKRQLLGESFKRNSTNVGGLLSLDYQFYASRHLMFNLTGTANYNFITEFSPTKFWAGVGIHYIFY